MSSIQWNRDCVALASQIVSLIFKCCSHNVAKLLTFPRKWTKDFDHNSVILYQLSTFFSLTFSLCEKPVLCEKICPLLNDMSYLFCWSISCLLVYQHCICSFTNSNLFWMVRITFIFQLYKYKKKWRLYPVCILGLSLQLL